MTLVTLVITLVVVGVALWLINAFIPMDGKVKQLMNVAVLVTLVLWLLAAFGVLGSMSEIRVGR